jgi:hypothetical protein
MTDTSLVSPGLHFAGETQQPIKYEELFGHVTLVEGYAGAAYIGCHALVALRTVGAEPERTVAVLTTELRLQSLLEEGLATGNLVAFSGYKMSNPPTPAGGTWTVDVYSINRTILYNTH